MTDVERELVRLQKKDQTQQIEIDALNAKVEVLAKALQDLVGVVRSLNDAVHEVAR